MQLRPSVADDFGSMQHGKGVEVHGEGDDEVSDGESGGDEGDGSGAKGVPHTPHPTPRSDRMGLSLSSVPAGAHSDRVTRMHWQSRPRRGEPRRAPRRAAEIGASRALAP